MCFFFPFSFRSQFGLDIQNSMKQFFVVKKCLTPKVKPHVGHTKMIINVDIDLTKGTNPNIND